MHKFTYGKEAKQLLNDYNMRCAAGWTEDDGRMLFYYYDEEVEHLPILTALGNHPFELGLEYPDDENSDRVLVIDKTMVNVKQEQDYVFDGSVA